MRYEPHFYQTYTKEFILSHNEAAIFLDCGLGKTVVTLTAVEELLHDFSDGHVPRATRSGAITSTLPGP